MFSSLTHSSADLGWQAFIGQPELRIAMASAVRSIFFYNVEPEVGQGTGLHLFEPRYRLLLGLRDLGQLWPPDL